MKAMDELPPKTKLMTLLNVEHSKPRKAAFTRNWHAIARLAQKPNASPGQTEETESQKEDGMDVDETTLVEDTAENETSKDAYHYHWESNTNALVDSVPIEALKELEWSSGGDPKPIADVGTVSEYVLGESAKESKTLIYNKSLLENYHNYLGDTKGDSLLELFSTYKDFFHPDVTIKKQKRLRSTLALHTLNHVQRTRARIMKNNEYLSKNEDNDIEDEHNIQDQGFTRPKVLVILPFRNAAVDWVDALTAISQTTSVEGKDRFDADYNLPEGTVDKLVSESDKYPRDHVNTFKGNIDDSFRVGVKLTRKTMKLYSEFYSSDIILASPLGLRTSIEKNGDSDFLSSIELVVVDQMDVLTMQNWEHLSFVFDKMNLMPKDPHGCDFSRVRSWYLDGKASFLRQTILLSSYETPEMRALFNRKLHNVGGKLKVAYKYTPYGVFPKIPKGLKQHFNRFDSSDIYTDDDARFEYFTTKTLPTIKKSAVSSSQTIIFVSSYFDFVRLRNYFTKQNLNFAYISEYTEPSDIARARGAFFQKRVDFLLVTERFHFFRRYRLRGARTFVFYSLPDHAQFYAEFLSFPFKTMGGKDDVAAQNIDLEPSDVTSHVVFSRFDALKLMRICGETDARKMVASHSDTTKFSYN